MSSFIFFLLFIPLIAVILLAINFIFAPHNPYEQKDSAFECGFSSFLGQNRTQFSISFFIFALLFLLFDLEILLVYPYLVSSYENGIYGLTILLVFLLALTLGFAFELGKKALSIDSRQTYEFNIDQSSYNIKMGILKNIDKRHYSSNKLFNNNLLYNMFVYKKNMLKLDVADFFASIIRTAILICNLDPAFVLMNSNDSQQSGNFEDTDTPNNTTENTGNTEDTYMTEDEDEDEDEGEDEDINNTEDKDIDNTEDTYMTEDEDIDNSEDSDNTENAYNPNTDSIQENPYIRPIRYEDRNNIENIDDAEILDNNETLDNTENSGPDRDPQSPIAGKPTITKEEAIEDLIEEREQSERVMPQIITEINHVTKNGEQYPGEYTHLMEELAGHSDGIKILTSIIETLSNS